MMLPQSLPIGFTYDGEPLYPAAPVAAGARQPLAMMSDGEPVWPAPGDIVPVGQPQPFGVLSSGAYVWAVEQRSPKPPTPWYRRKVRLTAVAAAAALLVVGAVAASSPGEEAQQTEQRAAQTGAKDEAVREQVAVQEEAADRAAAEQEAADRAAAEGAAKAEPPPGVDFLMPDFKGENLQDAQDRVQASGIFLSVSHDLIGARSQVLDSNWKVCTQTPAPGTRLKGEAADWEGKIDFGVVKLMETCP